MGGVVRTLALTGVAAAAWPAAAQVVPPRQDAPTREEIERLAPPTAPQPPSRVTIEGGIERAPCPLDDPRYAGITVTLREVAFDGLVEADPASLRPAYAALVGQTVPIATVCEIRDAAATILRNQGYLAAVQVPPQRIENGVVRFDVLMAKLVSINVRGDLGPSEGLIAGYLSHLRDGQVFNQRRAERYLLLAREVPGYDVRLVLRPAGTVPGEVAGDVIVERTRATLDLNVQNFGSREVGRWSGLAQLSVHDILGAGDRLILGASVTAQTREQSVLQAGYDLRLGSEGLTVGARYVRARTRPGIGGGDPLRARTDVASIEVGYPLVLRQATRIGIAGGFEAIAQDISFGGAPLTEDRLRVLYGRLDFATTDADSIAGLRGYSPAEPRWRWAGAVELRKGIDLFDASASCGPAPYVRCVTPPALSRLDADPNAGLVRIDTIASFRASPTVEFSLRPRAQYAFAPVAAYEEYAGGTYTIGRGYDPGAITGDDGIGVQAELRIGRILPQSARAIAIQPFVFFDAAWAWDRGRLSALPQPQRLTSAGGGVRAVWGDRARLDVTLAKPLERTALQTRTGDLRLLVNITTRIIPWSKP